MEELAKGYNPNYQDMAVKAAVVGYQELTGVITGDAAENGEGGADGEAHDDRGKKEDEEGEEEIEDAELEELEKKDLEGLLLGEVEGEGLGDMGEEGSGVCEYTSPDLSIDSQPHHSFPDHFGLLSAGSCEFACDLC